MHTSLAASHWMLVVKLLAMVLPRVPPPQCPVVVLDLAAAARLPKMERVVQTPAIQETTTIVALEVVLAILATLVAEANAVQVLNIAAGMYANVSTLQISVLKP